MGGAIQSSRDFRANFFHNGPQFVCKEFREFSNEWEFEHLTSSRRYPQSYGNVDNLVKTCKLLMKKAFLSKADVHLALWEFRNSPSERDGVRWSQKLFSGRTGTCLPTTKDLLKPSVIDAEKVVIGVEQAKYREAERKLRCQSSCFRTSRSRGNRFA